MKLKLGDRVEVHERGHASSGPYFPATVIRTPLKMKPHVTLLYVEYGIRTSSSDHHNPLENPLREIVNADNVRPPLLPAKELVVFKMRTKGPRTKRTKKDPLKVKVKVKSMKVKSSTPIKDNSLESCSTSNNKPLNNITIKEEILFKDESSVV
ncbi:hypothetical protein F8388_012976 [Cannabis sativa]|uniref:Agenet-like domain-containing protein n=1 Tax=Cannabis sativa TaxID=3483 RepID=A0A7J6EA49_CANSA|nr:hypothetical protein F8388_012976 [Cannabis sativa]